MKKLALFVFCALLVFSLTISCQTKVKPLLTIKVGHSNAQGDPSYDAWEEFKTIIEQESKGKIVVDVYPGETLGSETEMIEQVKSNALDMTSVNVAPLCQTFAKFNVFVLPYIWRDEQQMFAFCDSADGKQLSDEFKAATGMTLLAYWDNGVRHTFQKDKPVMTPDDFKGLKIRVMNNQVYIKFFGALGAQPDPMAFSEVYSALQTGVVDAADNDTSGYISQKFYEPAKYFSLTGHVISCKPVLASAEFLKKIDALPDDLKKIFFDAVEKVKTDQRANYVEKAQKDITEMQTKLGVKVNEIPDRTTFQAIAKAVVWPMFKDSVSDDLIAAAAKY